VAFAAPPCGWLIGLRRRAGYGHRNIVAPVDVGATVPLARGWQSVFPAALMKCSGPCSIGIRFQIEGVMAKT